MGAIILAIFGCQRLIDNPRWRLFMGPSLSKAMRATDKAEAVELEGELPGTVFD